MKRVVWTTVTFALLASPAIAQDYGQYGAGYPADPLPYGQEYIGSTIPSSSEPLFKYDDQEVWKHGWLQINPYEQGYHSYRPYNYKHVLSQSAQSAAWKMPSTMPYSQSYYLRHGELTDINGEPIPIESHMPASREIDSDVGSPKVTTPTLNPNTPSARLPGPDEPRDTSQAPQRSGKVTGLDPLPGPQLLPPQEPEMAGPVRQPPTAVLHPPTIGRQPATIAPASFQKNATAGPATERQQSQKAQILQFLQQNPSQSQAPQLR